MGLDDNELVDSHSISAVLRCSICQDVFEDPVCIPCQHAFCRACLTASLETGRNSCPTCRAPVDQRSIQPNLMVSQFLDELQVKCTTEGCCWSGRLDARSAHLQECGMLELRTLREDLPRMQALHEELGAQVTRLELRLGETSNALALRDEKISRLQEQLSATRLELMDSLQSGSGGGTSSRGPTMQAQKMQKIWRCCPARGKTLCIRALPEIGSKRIPGQVLNHGELFQAAEERQGLDGVTYLKLAGRPGWVFDHKPGVGVMCMPEAAEDLGPISPIVRPVSPIPVGLLFPGQGSQYVMMMSRMTKRPVVQEYRQKATEIMGYDLMGLCMNGPDDVLQATDVCQPAMFLAGMVALEELKWRREEAVTKCQAVAGLSLGEYTALCCAGVFGFEDGLRLVKLRGDAMKRASEKPQQRMLAVAGLEKAKLVELCQQAELFEAQEFEGGGAVCKIANGLFPCGFTCAGTKAAIEMLKDMATEAGAMQAKILLTTGAFHTELMQPAADEVGLALVEMLPRMKPPRCNVYMNVTGTPIRPGTQPKEIVSLLRRHFTSAVLWEDSVRAMIHDGMTEFYEVGPMKQIKAMMRRIDAKIWQTTFNIEV